MKFLFALLFAYQVFGVNLPPCPDDPVCPALPDNRWYPPNDPFDDPNVSLQHIDQYDCSSLNLKKRGFNCFGLLPNVLSKQQREIITEHGQTLGYSVTFLEVASDARMKLINTEFEKYDKYIKKTYQTGSPDRFNFVAFYRSFRNPSIDADETTVDFETIRDRALAKVQSATRLSQELNGILPIKAFFVVPVPQLSQMVQVGGQLLQQQPYPRLFFLNINEANKRLFFSSLLEDALQYVQRALTKLKNGHPCKFLYCSDAKSLAKVTQMFENVLNHPRFYIFQRPDTKEGLQGISNTALKDKGIFGLTDHFYRDPYEMQILTFIHETTHLYGTADLCYREAQCLAFLKEKPLLTLMNADSFALEIIEMGRINCNIKSPHPI